jgi:DNA repair protein RecO
MYSKLSTQAIVLKTDDVGEKDILVSLFTREFGFVYAKATGVRTQSSRLRFALQSMSLCFVSLVHGKTGWILTNATFFRSYYFESNTQTQKQTMANILHLIGRLYIGEEPHPDLFDFIEEKLAILSSSETKTDEIRQLEIFIVFKTLEKLGYIEEHATVKPLALTDTYSDELSAYIKENLKLITPFINSAIRTSGL